MDEDSLAFPLPLGRGVRVLAAHPSGWVALDKPAGILSTPNAPSDLKQTLLRAKFSKKDEAYVWYDEQQERRLYFICHRLDSPTSGVLLGSTDPAIARRIRSLFKERKIHKRYLALVSGMPRAMHGRWKDTLSTRSEKGGSQVRTAVKAGRAGEPSLTEWSVLRQDARKRLSLLSLRPLTGRTHQLRVQSAHHQLPIIGDRTYGDFKVNAHAKKNWGLQRLMLHAEKIQLSDPASGIELSVESTAPREFVQLFDN